MAGDALRSLPRRDPLRNQTEMMTRAGPLLGLTLSEVPDVRRWVRLRLELLPLARAVLRKHSPEVKDCNTTDRTSVLRLRSFPIQHPERRSDARVLAIARLRHQPGLACGVRLGSERERFAGLLDDQVPEQLALVFGPAQGEDAT